MMYSYNEQLFFVMMLIIFSIILGFVLGWTAHRFYLQYCKELDDECDELEYDEDEDE